MNLKQERFTSKVLLPLFQGIPQYPYSLVYENWAAYKKYLLNWGIPESRLPRPSPNFRPTKSIDKIKEVDFLIQVIIGDVLRKVSLGMKRAGLVSLQGTEKHAVRILLSLADEFFPFRNPQISHDQDRYRVDNFERLAELITGEHARLLVGACQRLAFFYKRETERERRQGKKGRDIKPTASSSSKPDESSTQLILKEEFVGRLHKAINQHPVLQDMISQMNLKQGNDNDKDALAIELNDEERGIFSVGKTDIDLRSVLLRIFVALKPEAELLLRLMISKIQPDRVNLIEIHYDAGLAEFEVAMMLEDGDISEDVHRAIYDCNTSTTFPKVVVVCSSILEEILGKKVNISFNRRGDVTIEVPEIEEVQSRNLAVALRKKIEEALHRQTMGGAPDDDPEVVQLKEIGRALESEFDKQEDEEATPKESQPVAEVDALLDEDLMRAAQAINAEQQKLAKTRPPRPAPAEDSAQEEPVDDPFSALRTREVAPLPEPTPEYRRGGAAIDGDDLAAQLADLDMDSPRDDNEQMITIDDDTSSTGGRYTDDASYFSRSRHPGAFLTPREVTMAILSDVRSKGFSGRSSDDLARAFIEVLDKVARDYCGQGLEKICPGVTQLDNIFDIARQLNEVIDKRRYGREPEGAIDALLSGAILASSSLKLSG